MTETMANQIVCISMHLRLNRLIETFGPHRASLGAKRHLLPYQIEEQNAHDEEDAHKAERTEGDGPSAHQRRGSTLGALQPIDQPGLPAQLSGHPTHRRCYVGKWKAEHENP